MINRKLIIALILITFAGLQSPLSAMAGVAAHPERHQRIEFLRTQINHEREFISNACWAASSCMAAATGLFAGWFFYKKSGNLPRFLQLRYAAPRAFVGVTGATLSTLGLSWLTKHWGMSHFFSHRGHIRDLKNEYHNLMAAEKRDREELSEAIKDKHRRINQLNADIRYLEQTLQNNNGTTNQNEIEQQRRALNQKNNELQQVRDNIAMLNQMQAQPTDQFFQQHIDADPALQQRTKQQLEGQLIREVQEAARAKSLRDHWIHICQLVMSIVSLLQPANAGRPDAEEISDHCKDALLPLLKFAIENHAVQLCHNLAHCGLKLHMLCRLGQQYIDSVQALFRNIDTELISQFAPTCTVCFENIDNNVHSDNKDHSGQVLPCGHVLCQACLDELRDHMQQVHNEKQQLHQAGRLDANDVPPAQPVCPECQAPIAINQENALH